MAKGKEERKKKKKKKCCSGARKFLSMCATKEDYIRRLKDDFEKTSGPCEFYAHGLEVFQQFLGTISMASLGITFFLTWVIQVSFGRFVVCLRQVQLQGGVKYIIMLTPCPIPPPHAHIYRDIYLI